MSKTTVGIDIGTCQLKLAVCSGGQVRRLVAEAMPDNLMRDGRVISPQAVAAFLKETAKKHRISTKDCGVILPAAVAFTRTMSLPPMSQEHLKLNLPYEFRDFITQEKDQYFYDYAVIDRLDDENGNPTQFEFMAAATLKETVKMYADLCRRAGFKLRCAIPEELAYMNLIRSQENGADSGREYCIIDLGHTEIRVHLFQGIKHQATRVVDYGANLIDTALAQELGVDEHIARAQKHAGHEALYGETCASIYATIAVEVMRAINFYRFNSPDSNLESVYLAGGGGKIGPLVEQISADLNLPVYSIEALLPPSCHGAQEADMCQTAIGVAIQ